MATALVNARLFEQQRLDAEAFELLAEIGREVAAVLDLDQLLARIAQLAKRVIDYRTFGILLLNESTKELEMKVAVQYGEQVALPKVPLGEGLVGLRGAASRSGARAGRLEGSALHQGGRGRAVGAGDSDAAQGSLHRRLRPREPGARRVLQARRRDSHAARRARRRWRSRTRGSTRRCPSNEARLEKELQFARRVQTALLPTQLPKRLKGVDVAAQFAPARELGGDFHDFLMPESNTLIVALGDVSGKGVPAALYSVFAGELVRGRTFRRRFMPERSTPGNVLTSINTHPPRAPARGVLLHAVLRGLRHEDADR